MDTQFRIAVAVVVLGLGSSGFAADPSGEASAKVQCLMDVHSTSGQFVASGAYLPYPEGRFRRFEDERWAEASPQPGVLESLDADGNVRDRWTVVGDGLRYEELDDDGEVIRTHSVEVPVCEVLGDGTTRYVERWTVPPDPEAEPGTFDAVGWEHRDEHYVGDDGVVSFAQVRAADTDEPFRSVMFSRAELMADDELANP